MTAAPTINLDHVGFIIPELERARALFAALGFTVTERADHTRRTAEGQTVSAGSAQHSIMLDRGYIELMQITDPAAGHQLTPAIHERYGLHVLALGVSDASAWHAHCVARGVQVGPVMEWSRTVSTPERSGLARFRFFDSPWQASDPSYVCWVQHMTPELVRSPSMLVHANSAHLLAGVDYAGPATALAAWSRRLVASGARAGQGADGGTLDLAGQALTLRVDEALPQVRPVGLRLGVTDLARFERVARQAGVPCSHGGARVRVDLTEACGLVVDATQAALT